MSLKGPCCISDNLRRFNEGVDKMVEDVVCAEKSKSKNETINPRNAKNDDLRRMIDSLNGDVNGIKEGMQKVSKTLREMHEMDNIIITDAKNMKDQLKSDIAAVDGKVQALKPFVDLSVKCNNEIQMLDSRMESMEVFANLTTQRMQAQHEKLVVSFEVVDKSFMKIHEDMMHLSSVLNGVVMALSNGTGGFAAPNNYKAEGKSVASVYKSFKMDKK